MGNDSGSGRGAGPEGGGLRGEGGQATRKGPEGRIARASGKEGPQIIHSKGKRWIEEAEEIFLDHLAVTANYTLAAKLTGFSREAIYQRRRRKAAKARL